MEENPPNEKKFDTCRRATGAGLDDWIICKSTKRNQTYYFNTLTGKSVWTLSEANKENDTVQTSQQCPQPIEPTVLPSTSQTNTVQADVANTMEVSNNQVVDYKFMQPPPILMSGFVVPQLGHFNNIHGNPETPFNNIVWNRPPPNYPPYPVLTVPPVQPHANDKHDIIVQNTAVPLSQRFKAITEQSQEPVAIQSEKKKIIGPFRNATPKRFLDQDDLRMKLTAKRKMQHISRSSDHHETHSSETQTEKGMRQLKISDEEEKETAYPAVYGNFKVTKDITENDIERPPVDLEKEVCNEDDEIWLQENMCIEDHKSRIDVSPLWDEAPDGVNTDCWYIMADTNVYISNLVFLNILIHSDVRCHLLLSKIVLYELEREADSTVNNFIKTLLHSGKAQKCGDIAGCSCVNKDTVAPRNDGCPLGDDLILECCLRVAANNYHVIVLSNDRLLKRKANTSPVPILKVDTVKELLARYRKNKDEKDNGKKILITIKNKNKYEGTQDNDNLKSKTVVYEGEEDFTEPYETYEDNEADCDQRAKENHLSHNFKVPKCLPTSPKMPRDETDMRNLSKVSNKINNKATSKEETYTSSNMTAKQRTLLESSKTRATSATESFTSRNISGNKIKSLKNTATCDTDCYISSNIAAKQVPHPDAVKNRPSRTESKTSNNLTVKQPTLSDTTKVTTGTGLCAPTNVTAKQRTVPDTIKNMATSGQKCNTSSNVTAKKGTLPDAIKDLASIRTECKSSISITAKQQTLSGTLKVMSNRETESNIATKQRTISGTIKNIATMGTECKASSNMTAHQKSLPINITANRETESYASSNVPAKITLLDTKKNTATNEPESNISNNITAKKRNIRLKRNTEVRRSPRKHSKPPLKWRRRPLTKPKPDADASVTKSTNDPSESSPKIYSKNRIQDEVQNVEATTEKNIISPHSNDDRTSSIGEISWENKRNNNEQNKTVDETSTSGSDVISNSRSSINSDRPNLNLSNYSYRKRTPAKTDMPPPMNNAMVFNLRAGCEDLVAQFVQIMEDMFQQVLLHIRYPKPDVFPMNLQEATVCIKIRFSKEERVREAASNFMELLLEFKDARGSVRRDLNPEDYMRMFGCGEKLARSLQEALPGYEDIESTLEYLDILLKDIKNIKTNDSSLIDDSFECPARLYDSEDRRCQSATETNSEQVNLPLEPHSPKDYQEITFMRTAPEGALKEHLSKKKQPLLSEAHTDPFLKPNDVDQQASDVPKKPGPKISCKFKICPLIEETLKLRTREAQDLEGDYDECLDYEEMAEEEEEPDPHYNEVDIEEDELDPNYIEVDEQCVEAHNMNGVKDEYTSSSKENIEQVGTFIKIFMRNISHTLCNVNNFCKDTYKELEFGNLSVSKRLEIQAKANKTHSMLDLINAELKRILERESNDSMRPVPHGAFRGSELSTYKEVILKCMEQVKVLLGALDDIRFLNNLSSTL